MAEGAKISSLPDLPTTTILAGDLWEVVRSGVNYKIPGSTFLSVIAASGGSGGGITDVQTTTPNLTYVRKSVTGGPGVWFQVTIPDAYTLPTATASVLGGIKVGNYLSIADGRLSANVIPDTSGSASSAYGMVKVDGTTIVSVGGVLTSVGEGGTAGVTSVGLSMPNIFTVTNSPVTTSGTLTAALTTQSANTIFAGPASGIATTPTFRAMVPADLPALTSAQLASIVTDETGTGVLVFATSPALDGNPTAPTQAAGNNSTRIATTAFVTAAVSGVSLPLETSTSNIKMNGVVSVGALSTVPRADHVHPVDISRAAKNGSGSEAFQATSMTCTSLVLNGHTLTIS